MAGFVSSRRGSETRAIRRGLGFIAGTALIATSVLVGTALAHAAVTTVSAQIEVGSSPAEVAVSPSGERVYVSNMSSASISVIDTSSDLVTATITLATGSSPQSLVVSPDGSALYVGTARYGGYDDDDPYSISVIDTSTNTETRAFAAPGPPTYLALSPDGGIVYFTANSVDSSNGTLNAYQTSDGTHLFSTAISGAGGDIRGGAIAVSPDGAKVYVPVLGTENQAVLVVDASAGTIIGTYPTTGTSAQAVAVSADGSRLYVPTFDGPVDVIDSSNGALITSYAVGSNPYQVGLSPDAKTLYVTKYMGDALASIDLASSVVTTVWLGSGTYPYGLGVKDDAKVYVALQGAAKVAVVTGVASGPTAPDAPTGLAATAGHTQVSLSWTAPGSNGGEVITDYVIEYKTMAGDDSTWATFADGTSTGTTATVTGLTNGTFYDFRVSAVNVVGVGDPSSVVTAKPNVSAPGAPTGLTATAGDREVALAWTAPSSDGGASISRYEIEYRTTSGGTWSPAPFSGVSGTSFTVSELTNGISYDFRVTAVNLIGTGAPSSTASATPLALPEAPSWLTATPAVGEVALSWQAPMWDGGAEVTDYVVEFKTTAGSTWSPFSDGTSTATTATVTGLTNGTSYDFRVSAVNALGTGPASSSVSATPFTDVPGAPTGLTATAGNGSVGLSWSAPASDGGEAITAYAIEYKSMSSSTWSTFMNAHTSTILAGLTNGTTYEFRVSAVNANGTGTASTVASATPTDPAVQAPPTNVRATGGILQAFVAWDRASDDLGLGSVTYLVSIVQGGSTFTCSTTETSCVVLGLAEGHVTANVVATSSSGTSSAATANATVIARSGVDSTPPADSGGVSIEFRDADGGLVTDAVPGEQLTVIASGFAPESNVDVFIYSVPQHLGSGVTNSSGTATFTVVVPTSLTVGPHTLVANGFNAIGATATARVAVQVGVLASTGGDVSGALIVGGLMLGAGAIIVLRARRPWAA